MNEAKNTEQRILEAAEKLFLEKGFLQSTTTQIASEAGVTHAMLHYYFRTKEQIFIQVLDKNLYDLGQTLRPTMSTDRPVWETLKNGMELFFDYLYAHPQLPGLIYDVACHHPQLLEKYTRQSETAAEHLLRHHQQMLDREIARKAINPVSLSQLIYDIISMHMSAFMTRKVLTRVLHTPEEQAEAFLKAQKEEIIRTVYLRLYGHTNP